MKKGQRMLLTQTSEVGRKMPLLLVLASCFMSVRKLFNQIIETPTSRLTEFHWAPLPQYAALR